MLRTRYGTSAWLEASPQTQRRTWKPLRGDAECDVVVVGGGLAGCMHAFAFAQARQRVILLEAERIAQQATAGAPGVLDAGAGTRFLDLRERHGLRTARLLWERQRRSSLEAQALIRRLRIRCGLERLDVVDIALADAQAAALEREHRALVDAGLAATWLTSARARTATGLTARGALKRGDAAWADPFRLALGLASHAERLGATICEGSPARRVKFGRRHVDILYAGGTLRAKAVVIATDLPQPDLRALHRHLRRVESVVVTVPPVPAEIRRTLGSAAAIVRDMAEPRHGWRLQADGGLLVWQAGRPPSAQRPRDTAAVQHSGELMYEFSVLHHAISGIRPSAGWIVTSHRSHDGMIVAGPHRAFPHHLFAVGAGVDGLQSAYLAARLNLRHHLGEAEPGDDLFGFVR